LSLGFGLGLETSSLESKPDKRHAAHSICGVVVGPALFMTCPMDVEKSQKWFGELWNYTIVPYLSQINKEFNVRVCVCRVLICLHIT